MNLKIFSIFDGKAQAYIQPFFLPTVGMAVRTFTDCVTDPGHAFGKHPEDYTLFEIGEFDDHSGEIEPHTVHRSLGNGLTHNAPAGKNSENTEGAS